MPARVSAWRTSSRTNGSDSCVEARTVLGPDWRKSSRSGGEGSCVEARHVGHVEVRDTKLGADSPILKFTSPEWAAFIAGVREGEFDL